MDVYKNQVLTPAEELEQDVECIRLFDYTGEQPFAVKVSPIAVPGIVFQTKEGKSAIGSLVYKGETISTIPLLFIYGPGTKPSVMNYQSGPWNMVQVIFKPHALRSLLGLNAAPLTDKMISWDEFAGSDISHQLVRESSQMKRVEILTESLIYYSRQTQLRDLLIEESLAFIHRDIKSINKTALLDHFHISERQFEKRFKRTVGITPYAYIRVVRFNEAINLMKSGKFERLVDVAYALNYYDQAHFIHDLKEFTGISPKSILEKVDSFHTQAGFSYT